MILSAGGAACFESVCVWLCTCDSSDRWHLQGTYYFPYFSENIGMDVFPPPFSPSYSKSLCEHLNSAPPVLMASNTSGGTRLLLYESVD